MVEKPSDKRHLGVRETASHMVWHDEYMTRINATININRRDIEQKQVEKDNK